MRHPIYAGFLGIHLDFLAANFNLRNVTVMSLLYFIQIGRLLREQNLLAGNPEYCRYAATV